MYKNSKKEGTVYITYNDGEGIIRKDAWFEISNNDNNIKKLVVGEGVRIIDVNALLGAPSEVLLPNTLVEIRDGAFEKGSMEKIDIPNSVQTLGTGVFFDCGELKFVKLPKNIIMIDKYTFSHDSSLVYVILPKGIKRIETGAFEYCNNLQYIDIPSSVEYIDLLAFDNASGRLIFRGLPPEFNADFLIENVTKLNSLIFCYPAKYSESWSKKRYWSRNNEIAYNDDEDPLTLSVKPVPTRTPRPNKSTQPTISPTSITTSMPEYTSIPVTYAIPDTSGVDTSVQAGLQNNKNNANKLSSSSVSPKDKKSHGISKVLGKNSITLFKPTFRLKKGTTSLGERCVVIYLKKYKGTNIEIFLHNGRKKIPIKLKKSKAIIKLNKGIFKLTYKKQNTVYRLSVRTYKIVKNKKIRSPFSEVKQIKV